MEEIKCYSKLAHDILEDSTDYIKSKNLIKAVFESDGELTKEKIILRLTIIDSIYSTNMGKRLFGISDLAEEIGKLSKLSDDVFSDEILINKLNNFLSSNTDDAEVMAVLTDNDIGITKKLKGAGKATSLLSKYFYFLLDYEFPIYDSLVKNILPEINKKYEILTEKEKVIKHPNEKRYFKSLIKFNKISKINNFNKLDNLCWLLGKVKKGSFSLILSKEKYKELIEVVKENFTVEEWKEPNKVDCKIVEYLRKNIPSDIFSKKQEKFIEWAYDSISLPENCISKNK